ncbi:hypothetical protein [Diaphorobacter aerolatus]|uniref:Uncharacterized protein n=1 Tax=Diaphorobacter aerolatus TaxID=1288495 RepID=A0A7H0GLJ1_9BURK|nr:hypothetical protein [Diaphorobacter aerolatus]QNP49157.1 hypothetical protein H9K75_03250 [Diaphorobacter aerolatus]
MSNDIPDFPGSGIPGLPAPPGAGAPSSAAPAPAGGESPGSFKDFGDDAKNAGAKTADAAAGTAANEARQEGAALANDLIEDAKQGKPPEPAAVASRAKDAGKNIAKNSGTAAIDTAKQQAQAQVDKSLAIIGNEFPILASILAVLSKPVIDRVLSECEMPDF